MSAARSGAPRRIPNEGSHPPALKCQRATLMGDPSSFGGGGGITRHLLVPRPSGRRCAAFGSAPGAARRTPNGGSHPPRLKCQRATLMGDPSSFGGGGEITRHLLVPRPSGRRCAAFGSAPGAVRRTPNGGSHPTGLKCQRATLMGDPSSFGGGGGNRTPVRGSSAFGSTCLVSLLYLAAGCPTDRACRTASPVRF